MSRYSLSVSAQSVIGFGHQLTPDLIKLVKEFGGRVDLTHRSTPTTYRWRGEYLDERDGSLEHKVGAARPS